MIIHVQTDKTHFYFQNMGPHGKDIFTASVFRSKPEIDLGFLRGCYWKYSAKPSNIVAFREEILDDGTEDTDTIQKDVFVAGQDVAAGLVRMDILPRIYHLLEVRSLSMCNSASKIILFVSLLSFLVFF